MQFVRAFPPTSTIRRVPRTLNPISHDANDFSVSEFEYDLQFHPKPQTLNPTPPPPLITLAPGFSGVV